MDVVRSDMVFSAAQVPIKWEEHYVGDKVDPRTESFLTWESLESVRRNGVGLKGPMATPIGKGHRSLNLGKGHRSLNLTLRKELGLYANVRPCYTLHGYKTRYDDVNLVTIREKTEGEYNGLESVIESLKIITCQASLAEYTFHYAKTHGRQRCCREVAKKYPEIAYEEVIIDNCCMMLMKNPSLFDVLVMPNLYGDIIGGLCAAIGGLGLTPSCNIDEGGIALAEAVHGYSWQGKAPLIRILHDKANQIHNAIHKTIAEGKCRTVDLGGNASTTDFTKAICDNL
ncbi:hypothetical protein AMTRI_Chr03g54180 [Amborella trichopoda]